MSPENLNILAIEPGIRLLGEKYNSLEAKVLMLAIAYQESACKHRAQIGGPAKGFWQFEKMGGVNGVLLHRSTSELAQLTCVQLCVTPVAAAAYQAIQYNDVLAACFARLLLWASPKALPEIGDADSAWDYYIEQWRPGKPHHSAWQDNYNKAVAFYCE